ncbi:hypothetical protein CISG_08470 [Coccidioides immitis RMSCC 3703]|uniref:Uncharacterized protein n=1 Tax=Coccidioides immitis RMSCC 3703 TaxID=454286 RepID=A0A0J8R809_COCIT|nr:hypothetical protein CISG_08470 [Coccidioides immitis RMSCC 3703]
MDPRVTVSDMDQLMYNNTSYDIRSHDPSLTPPSPPKTRPLAAPRDRRTKCGKGKGGACRGFWGEIPLCVTFRSPILHAHAESSLPLPSDTSPESPLARSDPTPSTLSIPT